MGSLFSRPKTPTPPVQKIPEFAGIKLSGSTYGQGIPLIWGHFRVPGNNIFNMGLREHVVREVQQTQSGKGGGSQKQEQVTETKTYFWTGAIAFAQGPVADVIRLWADSKLVFDSTRMDQSGFPLVRQYGAIGAPGSFRADQLGGKGIFRFYSGTEDQLPDPFHEFTVGVGNAPAYRGLCYIVFEEFPITDFGNHIPNITAELSVAPTTPGQNTLTYTRISGGDQKIDFDTFTREQSRGYTYCIDTTTADATNRQLIRFEDTSVRENLRISGSSISSKNIGRPIHAARNGIVYLADEPGETIMQVEPNGFTEIASFGDSGMSVSSNSQTQFVKPFRIMTVKTLGSGSIPDTYYMFVASEGDMSGGAVGWLNANTMEYVWGEGKTIDEFQAYPCIGRDSQDLSDIFVIGGPEYPTGAATELGLYRYTVKRGAAYDAVANASVGVNEQGGKIGVIAASAINPAWASVKAIAGPIYDPLDQNVMAIAQGDDDSVTMFKLDTSTGAIVWTSNGNPDSLTFFAMPPAIDALHETKNLSGFFRFMDSGFTSWRITTDDGTSIEDIEASLSVVGAQIYDPTIDRVFGFTTNTVTPVLKRLAAGVRVAAKTVFPRHTIEDVTTKVGLSPSYEADLSAYGFDISEGARKYSYLMDKPTEAREILKNLADAFALDMIETDFEIIVRNRGGATGDPILTLANPQLAIIDPKKGSIFDESRKQDVEIPAEVLVNFSDFDRDFETTTARAKRIAAPFSTVATTEKTTQQMTEIGLEMINGKRIAERVLYEQWGQRTTCKFRTDWSQLALDPGDVIQLNITNADTSVMIQNVLRLTKINVGANLQMDFEGETLSSGLYLVSGVAGSSGEGFPQETASEVVPMKIFLRNLPLLRDVDDVGRTALVDYWIAGGIRPGFQGGVLHKSIDNQQYGTVGQTTTAMTWGGCLNVLATPLDPYVLDYENSLQVSIVDQPDRLESCTYAQMMNGFNAALVYNELNGVYEIIQFQTVTQNDDGSFTLSNLLRGRRGTDPFVGDHTAGATFILLRGAAEDGDFGVKKMTAEFNEKDKTRYFRGVSFGQVFDDVDTISFTATGEELETYAPVQVTATLAGSDITIDWVRRTRINGGWFDGTGTVPLNEDSEAYEVDILDGPGGMVVQTLTSGTPTATYLAADIASDFGMTPTELSIRVYQLSTQVGRGRTIEVTVPVV